MPDYQEILDTFVYDYHGHAGTLTTYTVSGTAAGTVTRTGTDEDVELIEVPGTEEKEVEILKGYEGRESRIYLVLLAARDLDDTRFTDARITDSRDSTVWEVVFAERDAFRGITRMVCVEANG